MAGRNTDSFFKEVGYKWTGPVRIWVFVAALAAVVIGANFFMEDTYSSYQGIRALEVKYDLQSVTWEETYWSASLAAQVVQMLAMYIYLANTKQNKKWAIAAIVAFAIDFMLDAMYRSNGYIGGPERVVAIGTNTMIFSALSEVLITMGIGAALTLAPGAFAEFFALFGIGKRKGRTPQPQPQNSKPQNQNRGKQQSKQNQGDNSRSGGRPDNSTRVSGPSPEEIQRQMEAIRNRAA